MATDPGAPWDARAEAELARIVPLPNPPPKLTQLICSVCKEPQFETAHGLVCCNGHGGADSIEVSFGPSTYVLTEKQKDALYVLHKLTPADRVIVFNQFCKHCGDANPACQCWNDE